LVILATIALTVGGSAFAAKKGNIVLAKVNGEAITTKDVMSGVPRDAFGSTASDMADLKLEELINQISMRQFLKGKGIKVSDAEIDKAVADLRKHPPNMGCPCCRYKSLTQYMEVKCYAMKDLRTEVWNSLGSDKYMQLLWTRAYPTEQSRKALIAQGKKVLASKYMRAWQIFFNTAQAVPSARNVTEDERRKANDAWNQLKRGKSFEAVARSSSEDMMSRDSGGYLGFIAFPSMYGEEFDKGIKRLKSGEVGAPVQTPWGFHILKWQPITDDDVLEVRKTDFLDRKMDQVLSQVKKQAKVVRYHKSSLEGIDVDQME
jgi:parvulin-like peptidyl-prolyl isomerase